MQIHELNTFGGGTPGEMDFLALDTGFDTTKISAPDLLKPVRDQADDLGEKKVDLPLDEHNDPSYGTAGQLLRTKGDGSTEWVDEGLPTDEQTEAAINKWLDDHPEATTTVADGSLTEAKFSAALKLKTLKDYVTPEMFGAVGDGLTDDTAAWNAAIASGKPIVAVNNYLTTAQLSLDNDVYMLGTIYNDVSDAIKIDGKYAKTYILKVGAKVQNNSQFVGVDVVDSNNCQFSIRTRNFYIGAKFHGYSSGCAYNYIEKIFCANSKYFLLLQAENSGWCNENYFYNGRFIGETGSLYIGADYGITIEKVSGTHDPNSNHFINFCAEGSYCAVKVSNESRENSFENIRTEGCTHACEFDSKTLWNKFCTSYSGGQRIDNGMNLVTTPRFQTRKNLNTLVASSGSLAGKSASNATHGTAPNIYRVNNLHSKGYAIYNASSNEEGILSDGRTAIMGLLINVKNNHVLRVSALFSGKIRLCITPFDGNNDFITGANNYIETSKLSYVDNSGAGKTYCMQSDLESSIDALLRVDENAESAFVGVYLDRSGAVLHRLDIWGTPDNYEEVTNPLPMLSSVPTSNGYYINQTVYKNDGTIKWVWDGASWVEKTI